MIEDHYIQAILDGQFTFGYSIGAIGLTSIAVILVGLAFAFYWRTTRPISKTWKAFLICLRASSLLLIAFFLLEPGVLVSEVIPQQTYVAVLVDDSQSMSIQDNSSLPSRHDQTLDLLYRDEKIIERLAENFQVRTYRFSDLAERLAGPEALTQDGGRSQLSSALDHVMGELASFPTAAMIVVSDGADNSEVDPLQNAQTLAENNIPLYTVGIGEEDLQKDINIVDVSAAKSLLEGSIYTVDINVNQRGYKGQQAKLSITSDGVEVAQQSVALADDGNTKRFSLELKPEEEEIVVYNVAVEEKPGETIKQNNHYTFFIDNRKKKPLDILYIEGQPRNEYKFIRRALDADTSLRLVSYVQTGPRKYLRQGINSPQELSEGFPRDAETLFEYEAIVFGNVERSFFNDEQLQLAQDFVGKRGGGFLSVGGLNEAFIDSAIDDMLPVDLVRESRLPSYLQGGARRGDHPTGAKFPARVTRDGEYSPILRLASDDKKNRELWREMPELEGVYVSGRAKPGATVLMEHPTLSYQNSPLPILSAQRYGAGRSMVLATASSWRWQMLQPVADQSHERLWRQILRWLATESQQRVTISLDKENYNVGDTVEVSAHLLNEEFESDNDGLLWLEINKPDGAFDELPMNWQLEKDGTYVAKMLVEQEGVFDLTVKVPSEANSNLQAQRPLIVTPSRREFLQAGMDSGLLRRMAAASGGKFYTRDDANDIVNDITFNPNAYSQTEVHSFWDQPFFLYLLLALICIEWFARRYKGLS
ncbi:VWA domain-containing protein [Aurantivibrio infirmus]